MSNRRGNRTNRAMPGRAAVSAQRNRTDDSQILTISSANVSRLNSIGAAPQLSKILSDVNGRLTITVGPEGTTVEVLERGSGKYICGAEDLAKIGGIASFVRTEKRLAQSELGVGMPGHIVDFTVKAIREDKHESEWKPVHGPPEAYAVVQEFSREIETLDKNTVLIGAWQTSSTAETVGKAYLLECSKLIISTILSAMKIFVQDGQKIQNKVKEDLFDAGVPTWVRSKLSRSAREAFGAGSLRLLFPPKVLEGLSLSVKEWRSDAHLERLGPLLNHSHWVKALARDDVFLRGLCQLDAGLDLSDETLPKVSEVLKAPLNVVPVGITLDSICNRYAKSKNTGLTTGAKRDTPRQAISALSEGYMRAFNGLVDVGSMAAQWWLPVTGLRIDEGRATMARNIYAIAKDQNNQVSESQFLRFILQGDLASKTQLASFLGLWFKTETAAFMVRLRETAGISPAEDVIPTGIDYRVPITWDTDNAFSGRWGEKRADILAAVRENRTTRIARDFFQNKKKQTESKRKGLALTSIVPEAHAVLLQIEDKLAEGSVLAKKVETWFRGYTSPTVQRAAAMLVAASFDELFAHDDKSDSESDGDDDD